MFRGLGCRVWLLGVSHLYNNADPCVVFDVHHEVWRSRFYRLPAAASISVSLKP